jgi:sugar lactone lactonase YvrE
LLVTEDNRVYVMDRENHRWQVFTTDGEFISLQEHVSHPNRVALDAEGTFHIAGGAGIEIWKRDGTKIGSWGEKGEASGQFVAGSVHGAWMDSDGSLYTAEASRNNRLQKFVRV